MAKRPIVKKRTAAAPRPVRAAPESRAAGHPVPASAAATAPMAGAHGSFYDPEPAAAPGPSPLSAAAFTDTVRARNVALERGGSADVEVAEHLAAEVSDTPEQLEATIARIRQFRKPLGAMSQKLALATRPGYHRHWFNDVAGRIEEAEANGWAFVRGKDNKPLSRCVGTGRDKGAQYAFAMELPLVFWQEDQDARHRAASEKIEALKATPFRSPTGTSERSDKGKFYDPHEESGAGPLQVVKG